MTNDDGSVWTEAVVSGAAGAQTEVTPKAAGNVSFTGMKIAKDKNYWQSKVQQDSGMVNYLASRGFMDNRQNIQAVYKFYQNLFVQNTNFLWAGLAKLAGAPVYAGLSDAQYAKTGLLISGSLIPAVEAEQFQQTLIGMNIAILNDLAWQFEAYKNGGTNAIYQAWAYSGFDLTVLNQDAINAWGEIDQGIQTSDTNLIEDGNEKLLQREQQQTLANGYTLLNAMPGVSSLMSSMAQNPVPIGFSFSVIEPSGNLCVYADRWDWLTKPTYGMWWLWVGNYTSQQLEWVEIPLKTRAAGFAFFSPLPLY